MQPEVAKTFIKIGRVRLHSWINEKLPAADIIISEREIVHIANKHSHELASLGMEALLGQAA